MEQSQKLVSELVEDFKANEHAYLSPSYQESQVRQDFIDKFFSALGWDVTHNVQKNPYQQEVKIENKVTVGSSQKRADYAFSIAPNYEQVKFFVEAKKPSRSLANPDDYFQTIRYAWNTKTPISVLTDFEEFHILDCRHKPKIDDALNRKIESFHYSDYTKEEIFAKIYHLFARDAVLSGSLDEFISQLQKRIGKTSANYQPVDDAFLEELDEYRVTLAKAFKKTNERLQGEELTEAVQRTIDRLVFIRFLEDKGIEDRQIIKLANQKSPWLAFVALCKRLDPKYNGLVFKPHRILDSGEFNPPDEKPFAQICRELSDPASPYDFNQIPVSILGSIYERFLGKIVHATDKRVKVEEKPEVRKAGGVYYTPDYIVQYIVKETVGKVIEGKTPQEISQMAFADIACGSGSFLIQIYQQLLDYHITFFNEHPEEINDGDVVIKGGVRYLSLKKKKEILINNLYGVDIDYQATEVTQLSLYLKLLEDVTLQETHQLGLFKETILPTLTNNIICGNSLVGHDINDGTLFDEVTDSTIKPLDYSAAYPKIMKRGGFNVIVGNPPYGMPFNAAQEEYLTRRYPQTQKFPDSYCFFMVRALSLVQENGFVSLIVPNTFCDLENCDQFRYWLLCENNLDLIWQTGWAFKDAVVDTLVFRFAKNKPTIDASVKIIANNRLYERHIKEFLQNSLFKIDYRNLAVNKEFFQKIFKSSVKLGEIATVKAGVKMYEKGKGKPPQSSKIMKDRPYSTKERCPDGWRSLYRGKDIDRYSISHPTEFVSYGPWLAAPREPDLFESPKILMRRTDDHLRASIENNSSISVNSCHVIKIYPQFIPSLSYHYLLGLLNSRLIQRIFEIENPQMVGKVFAEIKVIYVERLPIRIVDEKNMIEKDIYHRIVNLVQQLLDVKRKSSVATMEGESNRLLIHSNNLDRKIDEAVYELYGLTEEEIQIVEGV